MPKKTYTHINSVTLAASSSSISFTSIPQNFRDLVLVSSVTGSSPGAFLFLRPNGDSGNASIVQFYTGTGGAGSNTRASLDCGAIYGSNICQTTLNIFDYSMTDKHKSFLRNSGTPGNSEAGLGMFRWASTAALTSILLVAQEGVVSSGSTFTLYGIEA